MYLLLLLLLLQHLQLLLLLLNLLLEVGQLLLGDGSSGRVQQSATVNVDSVVIPVSISDSVQEAFQGVGIIDHVHQTLPIAIHIRQVLKKKSTIS